jgi:dipeptidyl aminopeptidase/acylaminoacyl peptidase
MPIPLIPRKVLFGNPDKAAVKLSPDGAQIAYLAPLNGILNVWVAPRDDLAAARPVTRDTGRGIRFYLWAFTNAHIVYIQDRNGDENWRVYALDLANGETRDLTPFDGVQARIQEVSYRFPNEILVALNNRDPQLHDIFRANLLSGQLTLIQQNDAGFAGFLTDLDYRVRIAVRMTADGGQELLTLGSGGWETWETILPEDVMTTTPAGFDQTGNLLYMLDSRGRNTSALLARDMAGGQTTLLAEDPLSDVGDPIMHPTALTIQAISFTYERKHYQILDQAIAPDLAYLAEIERGEVEVLSRTLDDHYWIVSYVLDDSPLRFYLYDRQAQRAAFLFSNRKELEGLPLAKMHSAVIKTRDGLDMVIYYSLPPDSDSDGDGIPDRPLAVVSLPHGGPWGRDTWGLDPWHQWLANRGYVALNMNFRASTGFGKAFTNAGDREWGGKIIEDQVDAVQWVIRQGIADPGRVAIMGGSFGGYSTLAGLTFYPEIYACGVDIVGPANLVTLMENIPPYWKPQVELFATRVGDHRTPEGRALLQKHSPLTYANRIRVPLLIGQGANDPRVNKVEPEQIVAAMQARNLPVTYVLYTDEGHGFARPANRLSFNAITEAFLAKCLGGRCEPVGSDFEGSSHQILVGTAD